MERRMKISLARIVGAALLAFAFLVCSNPIDIVGTVTTEVKTANNKFLIVKSVGPATNTTDVNPGLPLTIVFDRDVDPTNFSANIVITPPAAFKTPNYNQTTKTLSIDPDPFLQDKTEYTVTITKGARGSDGSDLQNEYSWAFTTGEYPTASVQISQPAIPEWTKLTLTNNDAHPSLLIASNLAAKIFRLGRTESECLNAGWQPILSTKWQLVDSSTLATPFTLGASDGQQSVYIQAAKADGSSPSLVKYDVVTMDKTPPTVDAGADRWVNASTTAVAYGSASDANGIKTIAWSALGDVVFSATNVLTPTLSNPSGTDGGDTVTLTVTDNAGNPASDTMTLTKDTFAPNAAPAFTSAPATPTSAAMPAWIWSSKSTGGGESTPIFRVLLDGDLMADKSTRTSFVPVVKPPRYFALVDGAHTLTVYETDLAGNLSAGVTSQIVVSGLPNKTKLTDLVPLVTWPTLWDKNGNPSKIYFLHIGLNFVSGEMKEIIAPIKVAPNPTKDQVQSYQVAAGPVADALKKCSGLTVYWYIDNPEQGVRCPADGKQAWSVALP